MAKPGLPAKARAERARPQNLHGVGSCWRHRGGESWYPMTPCETGMAWLQVMKSKAILKRQNLQTGRRCGKKSD